MRTVRLGMSMGRNVSLVDGGECLRGLSALSSEQLELRGRCEWGGEPGVTQRPTWMAVYTSVSSTTTTTTTTGSIMFVLTVGQGICMDNTSSKVGRGGHC